MQRRSRIAVVGTRPNTDRALNGGKLGRGGNGGAQVDRDPTPAGDERQRCQEDTGRVDAVRQIHVQVIKVISEGR